MFKACVITLLLFGYRLFVEEFGYGSGGGGSMSFSSARTGGAGSTGLVLIQW